MSEIRSTGNEGGGFLRIQDAVRLDALQADQRPQGIVQQRQVAGTGDSQRQFITTRTRNENKKENLSRSPLVDASTYQERYAIRRYLATAEQVTEKLVELAKTPDPVELALCIKQLRQTLQQLWKLRKAREDEWGEVLNFVQGVLGQVVAEQVTLRQASAILAVIRNHLAMGATLDHQPRQVRIILREAGLDPWVPLQLQEIKDNGDTVK